MCLSLVCPVVSPGAVALSCDDQSCPRCATPSCPHTQHTQQGQATHTTQQGGRQRTPLNVGTKGLRGGVGGKEVEQEGRGK